MMLNTVSHEIGFIIFLATLLGWFTSISLEINNQLPPNLKSRTKLLLIATGFTFIYSINAQYLFQQKDIMLYILPFHFFAMYGMFYSFFFAARQIKTYKLKRPVAYGECLSLIFAFWFFPIGLWFIQPTLNSIQDTDS